MESDDRRLLIEQAGGADSGEVDLSADDCGGRPEVDESVESRQHTHEVLPEGVPVGLDVLPEVTLRALGTIDHRSDDFGQLLRESDGLIDTVADLEEDAVVALLLDGFERRDDVLVIREHAGDDRTRDEGFGIECVQVERVVLVAAERVLDAAHERLDGVELGHDSIEVRERINQVLTADSHEAGVREDDVLDGDVAEHELSDGAGQCACTRNGERQADLAGGLVVDSSHEENSFCSLKTGFPLQCK